MKHLRGKAIFKLIFKLSKTTAWELLHFEIQHTKGLAYFYNFYIVRNSLPLSFSNPNSIKNYSNSKKGKSWSCTQKNAKNRWKAKAKRSFCMFCQSPVQHAIFIIVKNEIFGYYYLSYHGQQPLHHIVSFKVSKNTICSFYVPVHLGTPLFMSIWFK